MRRPDERPVLGDRGDAAEHDVGRGDKLADLAPLRLAVHLEDARPDRVVPPRFDQLAEEPDVLERFRFARMDLGALRDQAEDDRPRLLAGVNDDRFDVVQTEGGRHSLDETTVGRVSRRALARDRRHSGSTAARMATATPTARLARPIRLALARSRARAAGSTTFCV
jgi:hypothetical protein